MATTQTTIVVSFGDDSALSEGYYSVELDAVGNEDRSSFAPNEEVLFLIQHDSTMQISRIVSTNGSIQSRGDVSRTKEETILFAEEGESQSLPCLGSLTTEFKYNSCALESDSVNSTDIISAAGNFPALCDIAVVGSFHQYALIPSIPDLLPDETYDVYIVIYFEAS